MVLIWQCRCRGGRVVLQTVSVVDVAWGLVHNEERA